MMAGRSLDTTNMRPRFGSTAELPQVAPPEFPGICTVPCRLGGVKIPSLRNILNSCRILACSASVMYGLMSFSVNDCLANGGGLVGNGCVGQASSPGTSDFGTVRSSTGQRGSPVRRLKTKRNPCLVGCATASTVFPSCFTVNNLGALGKS